MFSLPLQSCEHEGIITGVLMSVRLIWGVNASPGSARRQDGTGMNDDNFEDSLDRLKSGGAQRQKSGVAVQGFFLHRND